MSVSRPVGVCRTRDADVGRGREEEARAEEGRGEARAPLEGVEPGFNPDPEPQTPHPKP